MSQLNASSQPGITGHLPVAELKRTELKQWCIRGGESNPIIGRANSVASLKTIPIGQRIG